MQLENLVIDALDPQRLGRQWESVVGTETLTDAPGIYETRFQVDGGPWLDLCFPQVPEPPTVAPRLHVVLGDGDGEHTDLDGNPYAGTGPLTALRLESADPDRDAAFWAWLTGWRADGRTLHHPTGRGHVLELVAETAPKGEAKNRLHLDVRLEPGEDAGEVAAAIAEHGGRALVTDWGELPWRSYADPSGNEFCVLPVSASHPGD